MKQPNILITWSVAMRTKALVFMLAACALCIGATAQPAPPANLLPNPSFELVEPPPPVAGVTPTLNDWLPRTWSVWGDWGAVAKSPADLAQAHSGQRCVTLKAQQGVGHVRYGPMPVLDDRPWTLRFWARGNGQLVFTPFDVKRDRWDALPTQTTAITDAWKEYEFAFKPPVGCRQWLFDLATKGKMDAWLDDALVTYDGFKALGLPPDKPLERDASALLLLDFEKPFDEDAFYVGGKVSFSKEGEGRFGKSLVLGADGYVACSANENVDPAQGTIEVWCKFLTPGDDLTFHPIVSIPGMEGMSLHKDQYSHICFSFSSGWATLSYAQNTGYAAGWQPGAWRHFVACWDKDLLQVFVDGKLVAWKDKPTLSKCLGPELRIGGPDMELDDLRISNVVRYRQLVPPPEGK